MIVTLELPEGLSAWAEEETRKRLLRVEDYLVDLLEDTQPMPQINTGAELLEYWKSIGFVGMWADREEMTDSAEYVRHLREKTQANIAQRSARLM